MFAGHVGAGLAIAGCEPRINAGWLVFAALWLDTVLWILVLAGVETVALPAPGVSSQPSFVFPYSHGLIASLAWSALAAAAVGWAAQATPGRAALLMAAAVASHWLLDVVVHRPELPLVGAASIPLGLGLYDRLPVALGLEAAVLVAGAAFYARRTRLAPRRRWAILATAALSLLMTIAGMTLAPPPPSATTMAVSSLVTILVLTASVGLLARERVRAG
ncbi:MAG: hypothetical protein JSR73_07915 [Proteobacteria bacterium]|nr:hypothetical protein [Pseudomonadota bacterium]